jgi:hypothetical protein
MRSIALGLIVIASILLIEDWITCLVKKNEGNMAVREIITLFLGAKDFVEFKKLYNKNKKQLSYDYRQTYDEWWDECNTDGSFAYNNVTDDF